MNKDFSFRFVLVVGVALLIAVLNSACGAQEPDISQDLKDVLEQPVPTPVPLVKKEGFASDMESVCGVAIERFNKEFNPPFYIPPKGVGDCSDAIIQRSCVEQGCDWPGPEVDVYGVSDGYRAATAASDQLQLEGWVPFAQGTYFIQWMLEALETERGEG